MTDQENFIDWFAYFIISSDGSVELIMLVPDDVFMYNIFV